MKSPTIAGTVVSAKGPNASKMKEEITNCLKNWRNGAYDIGCGGVLFQMCLEYL